VNIELTDETSLLRQGHSAANGLEIINTMRLRQHPSQKGWKKVWVLRRKKVPVGAAKDWQLEEEPPLLNIWGT